MKSLTVELSYLYSEWSQEQSDETVILAKLYIQYGTINCATYNSVIKQINVLREQNNG